MCVSVSLFLVEFFEIFLFIIFFLYICYLASKDCMSYISNGHFSFLTELASAFNEQLYNVINAFPFVFIFWF